MAIHGGKLARLPRRNLNEREGGNNMALRKRNGTYHCDFMVNGQRCRQTLETRDRREAVQRERDLMAQAKQGKLAGRLVDLARVNLSEAFDRLPERTRT